MPIHRTLAGLTVPVLFTAALCAPETDRQTPGAEESADAGVAQEAAPPAGAADSAWTWTFDDMAERRPPAGFSFGRTGGGMVGTWVIRTAADAPSRPNVLVQTDTDATNSRLPVAVADSPAVLDLTVSVRCKMISGRVDQACGVVFRYRDQDNYYVTRANALEDNVRLYYVRNGRRTQIADWSGRVTPNEWHELRADARGDQLEVYWDGRKVVEQRDATFSQVGRVGLWLKADSYTEFDDLRVAALAPAGR